MPASAATTLTFLFTDIEGSTRRWEHQRAAMAAALARHDALLRAAIEDHGGTVFKTMGDAFCAVFGSATAAIEAAIAGQRALVAEDWAAFGAELGGLRVRMGLHTGEVEAREGDYFGPAVNRVARLMACGHGGQILVSGATSALVGDALPTDCALRDLGERRLKDLRRPEHVFQVLVPGLPADFPPLVTLDARPNNLPHQLTSLVGRETEVADLAQLLREDAGPRLVTLTGAGGTGKTRLALQVAADLFDHFDHGVWFVDLAPLTDPELVAATIARTLAVEERPGQDTVSTLREWLANRRLLVVLDNYERLLPAAPLVADLLGAAPALKTLVTSREALHLRGERVVPVQPLAVPAPGSAEPPETLLRYDAVILFVQHATDVDPTFTVTGANAPSIAEICARLDGLPLAIGLAAARVPSMSPRDILARLDSRMRLLTRGARDMPERHRTIRATISWSYELLEPGEQRLLRRLAVFAGGARLASAEAVCDDHDDLGIEVVDGLASLVEKSLVRRTHDTDGSSRYHMLQTVRDFALELLGEGGELESMHDRHAAWAAALSIAAWEQAIHTSEAGPWIDHVEREVDDLRTAMTWCMEHAGQADAGYAIAETFRWLLSPRGYYQEARTWGRRALATVDRNGSRSVWAARVVAMNGGYQRLPEAIERFQSLGDWAGVAGTYNEWGEAAKHRGELDRAEDCFLHMLALQSEHGLRKTEKAIALGNLGEVAHLKGDLALAEQRYRECLEVGQDVIWPDVRAEMLKYMGCVAWARGDAAVAKATLREALRLVHDFRSPGGVAECLAVLASMTALTGDADGAALLLGASEAILRSIDPHAKPIDQAFDPIANDLCAKGLAAVADALPPDVREQLWAEGAGLDMAEAVSRALGGQVST